jgi:tetratricopeptide (TPR) repeat protein
VIWGQAALLTCLFISDVGDEQLQQELRARGLNQLLEAMARQRLEDRSLSPSQRADAAFDLASSISRRANRALSRETRKQGWDEADTVLKPYLQAAIAQDPSTFEFRFQCIMMLGERAETLNELTKVLPNDTPLAEDAKFWARKSAESLGQLNAEVRRRHNQTVGGKPEITTALADLDNRSAVQAGLAYLTIVLAEPEGAERSEAALEAEKRLKEYSKDFFAHPLKMNAVLGLGRLYRALGRTEEALQTVAVFDVHPEVPPQFRARAQLLTSQLLLELNRTSEALQRLNVPQERRLPGGEWSLALFEALLRASQPDIRGPELRRDEALTLLDNLEKNHGTYWKIRGEQVLAKYGNPAVMGDNPALLRYVADLRRQRKEWDAAIALYDRAAALEQKSGATEKAMRLWLSAAATVSDKGDKDQAVERFFKVAELDRTVPVAADAFLGAAGAIFPKYQKGDATAQQQYRRALESALSIPSIQPHSRGEVLWLRGRLNETEKRVDDAWNDYRQISPDHPRFAAAFGALAVLLHDSLIAGNSPEIGEPIIERAIADLEQRLPQLKAQDAEATRSRVLGRWVLANLLAERKSERIAEAIKLVQEGVLAEPAGAFLQRDAFRKLIRWHLRNGDAPAALLLIQKLYSVNDTVPLLRELSQYSPLDDDLSDKEIKSRAEVLDAISSQMLSQNDRLDERSRRQLNLLLGLAYSAKGDHFSAHRILRQLRQEFPRDPAIAQAFAQSLFRSGDYRESAREWNALYASGPRIGKEAWLNIAVHYCRCLIKLDEKDRVRSILDHIQKNHRGAGSSMVQAKLAQLRQQVEK